jgi:hypothetical protein
VRWCLCADHVAEAQDLPLRLNVAQNKGDAAVQRRLLTGTPVLTERIWPQIKARIMEEPVMRFMRYSLPDGSVYIGARDPDC